MPDCNSFKCRGNNNDADTCYRTCTRTKYSLFILTILVYMYVISKKELK